MPLQHHFDCPLPNGTHARPASALEEVARSFASEITLLNQRTGRAANAKNILSIVGADVRFKDPCLITVTGSDEHRAMPALVSFLRDRFPKCDHAPPAAVDHAEFSLPPLLRDAGVTVHRGTAVVSGIARGVIHRCGGFRLPPGLPLDGVTDVAVEQRKINKAIDRLTGWYTKRLETLAYGVESEILSAHRSMARDVELRNFLLEAVAGRGRTAAGAVADAEAHFGGMLSASGNTLLRERTLDIQDICRELIKRIYGGNVLAPNLVLTGDAIVVAESLTPGQFLALDRKFLRGLVLARAGTTSHTVILARSFCIPTLVGVEVSGLRSGEEAVVDSDLGAVVTDLSAAARRYYALEQTRLTAKFQRLKNFAVQPARTAEGSRVEISANIGIADEAALAFAGGAEGIGLFRTEMLFLERDSAPDEAEQLAAYRQVLSTADGQPVVIRTLDIGGDKPLPYLNLPAEENPFLGYRAVRIYPEFETIFRTQIRALVRASAHGRLKILVPMIATVEEVRRVKRIIAEEQARCAADKISFDPALPVGVMIEVPAVAFALDELCRELDFFSLGSNDLLQYFMAADRANPKVSALYDPLQPAFLRLLKQIVDTVQRHQKPLSLCGEMAGQLRLLPLLVGSGLEQFSVAAPVIASLKAAMAKLRLADCCALFKAALNCSTADEVAAQLENFSGAQALPLMAPDLVAVQVSASSKAEAIKQAVDLLNISGRAENFRAVEEAVWQRESTYSTGFGHGFAIPHCKTDAVAAGSLVILKLAQPVDWGSLDGRPVRVVILLVMRESDAANGHMKVFAQLARKIMHESFRARLEMENDPAALCAFVGEAIQV